jgi:hypothetical protein
MSRTHRCLPSLLLQIVLLAACSRGAAKGDPVQPPPVDSAPVTAWTTPPALRVAGHDLVNAAGKPVRLQGVNRSGTEYACIQGWGMGDGPRDSASVEAMRAWKINVVRVPLNESCWLGTDGVKPEYGGANYQQMVADWVGLLTRRGMVVILELHWIGAGTTSEAGQKPMPVRATTPLFWSQVAARFKGNESVIFDLFNEPFPDSNRDSEEAWRCWRDGGSCAGMAYVAAGMQELVDTVRATGAGNVIMLGGVQYANALSGWLSHRPTDPMHRLAASWHVYDFNACNNVACWNAKVAPVAAQVPLVVGEVGDNTSGSAFVTSVMDWVEAHHGSELAWVWNVWGSPLDLIASYDGTPTTYGRTFRTRFLR